MNQKISKVFVEMQTNIDKVTIKLEETDQSVKEQHMNSSSTSLNNLEKLEEIASGLESKIKLAVYQEFEKEKEFYNRKSSEDTKEVADNKNEAADNKNSEQLDIEIVELKRVIENMKTNYLHKNEFVNYGNNQKIFNDELKKELQDHVEKNASNDDLNSMKETIEKMDVMHAALNSSYVYNEKCMKDIEDKLKSLEQDFESKSSCFGIIENLRNSNNALCSQLKSINENCEMNANKIDMANYDISLVKKDIMYHKRDDKVEKTDLTQKVKNLESSFISHSLNYTKTNNDLSDFPIANKSNVVQNQVLSGSDFGTNRQADIFNGMPPQQLLIHDNDNRMSIDNQQPQLPNILDNDYPRLEEFATVESHAGEFNTFGSTNMYKHPTLNHGKHFLYKNKLEYMRQDSKDPTTPKPTPTDFPKLPPTSSGYQLDVLPGELMRSQIGSQDSNIDETLFKNLYRSNPTDNFFEVNISGIALHTNDPNDNSILDKDLDNFMHNNMDGDLNLPYEMRQSIPLSNVKAVIFLS